MPFNVSALVVFSAIAWFAGWLGEWLRGSPQVQRLIQRLAAGVYVALALRLLLSER